MRSKGAEWQSDPERPEEAEGRIILGWKGAEGGRDEVPRLPERAVTVASGAMLGSGQILLVHDEDEVVRAVGVLSG